MCVCVCVCVCACVCVCVCVCMCVRAHVHMRDERKRTTCIMYGPTLYDMHSAVYTYIKRVEKFIFSFNVHFISNFTTPYLTYFVIDKQDIPNFTTPYLTYFMLLTNKTYQLDPQSLLIN